MVKLGWYFENFHAVCHGRHHRVPKTDLEIYGPLFYSLRLCELTDHLAGETQRKLCSLQVHYLLFCLPLKYCHFLVMFLHLAAPSKARVRREVILQTLKESARFNYCPLVFFFLL